jgi:SAM-dependent methyltransferase
MEDWDQVRAYAGADFSDPHQHFVDLFRACLAAKPVNGVVLDLGCGAADIAIRLACALPHCVVRGVDGSAPMIELGRAAVAAAGLTARVELFHARLDLASPRFPLDSVAVISNSLLHHLHDPMLLWRFLAQHVLPGTKIFIMDLLRPETELGARDLVARYAANEPAILQRDFFNSLCAAYRVEEISAQLREADLSGLSVSAVSDRHWVVHGVI